MKKLTITIIVIVVAAGAWYLLFGFGGSGENAQMAVAELIVTPTRGNLRVTINSTGKVEPVKTVEVKSKASGEVIELNFEAGDYVIIETSWPFDIAKRKSAGPCYQISRRRFSTSK